MTCKMSDEQRTKISSFWRGFGVPDVMMLVIIAFTCALAVVSAFR